jgi:PAS domain S-box-containing protein
VQTSDSPLPAIGPSTNELEQIRYALDQSAIVAIADVHGRITYVNDKFTEISKYSREELLGQDHRIINSGYHTKAYIRTLWRTIARGEIWHGEFRNRAKDGSLYWVDTTIVPFLDASGKPWQYMAIRYDITARKQQEQRLHEQAALTALGEMAAVVTHEVRNPLAGIRSGLQLLSALSESSAESRGVISDIIARVDSLNVVLSDLLTFAHVREVKRGPVDVGLFLSDMRSATLLDPEMRGITLELHGDLAAVVEADVDQLRLVFTNLLLNAAQAMRHGGRIDVGVRVLPDGGVELTVADSGHGIPVELQERVFEPFFTTKHQGSGLGLPTARRLIEAHGGTLLLETAPSGGALARVTLPRRSL